MSRYTIENDLISIEVDSFGAELKSLKRQSDNREYMWYADPTYWKRTAPVLFPLVGSLYEGKYRVDGVEYEMSQHGFARDTEFELVESGSDYLLFAMESTDESYARYPYHFRLEIGYRIFDMSVEVSWKVVNTDTKEMFFSIGAHPAFLSPVVGETLSFDANGPLISSVIGQGGVLSGRQTSLELQDGKLAMTDELFENDALIIENDQAHRVSLIDAEDKVYLTCEFTAPLFGVWTPPKKKAPFVCIEPWYGRCDREGFTGDISEREWGNKLAVNDEFIARVVYSVYAE